MRIASQPLVQLPLVLLCLAGLTASRVVNREDPPLLPPEPDEPVAAQATITSPNGTAHAPAAATPPIPITVKLFASSPGVRTCRSGSRLVNMVLPPNASSDPTFTTAGGQCYNLPGTAQCGIFMANKADGCEAKLFRGERCAHFVNLAVFLNEARPVGGYFTSMSIKCGVKSVEPPPLNLGGLGAQTHKPAKGKDARGARTVDSAMGTVGEG
ncbi:hypothetical protein CTRI78_v006665 [Colletotrichum trifolii]|uniref:Sulfate permease ii n=1 Tax=Colletotrichum trifolii TaxID=5466 RepID=A0A4R8RN23_COLTR|nr:hypothetical protein CTRI78_v006665 [Colletotrichum trifolii]